MPKAILPQTNTQRQPYQTGRVSLAQDQRQLLPSIDLVDHQIKSFNWFVSEGINQLFEEINPIEDAHNRLSLRFKRLNFEQPVKTEIEALNDKQTYESLLKAQVTLTNKQSDRVDSQVVYMDTYPWMTDRGTFVINGSERVVVSQIVRSSGVFFVVNNIKGRDFYGAKIAPYRGSWLEISTLASNEIAVKIDRRRKVPITTLLIALGMTRAQIKKAFAGVDKGPTSYIDATLERDSSLNEAEAAREVYHRLRPGDLAGAKNAQEFIADRFYNPRNYDFSPVGRYKMNQRLGMRVAYNRTGRTLSLKDIIAVVGEVIRLNVSGDPADDIDSLSSRRIRLVGESLSHQFRFGLMRLERNIIDRMNNCDLDTVTPRQLINPRPISARVRSFFTGTGSPLSQFMDQLNPLSELAHKRRLTATGPGGLNSRRAGFAVRDAHPTHYGRICPVETPEGTNVGLNLNLALYARIDQYGFLQTPYRLIRRQLMASDIVGEIARGDLYDSAGKILVKDGQLIGQAEADKLATANAKKTWPIRPKVTDEVVYLDANSEHQACILTVDTPVDDQGYFVHPYGTGRQAHVSGQYNTEEATHIETSYQQLIGSSAALIPFVEKDYVLRSLTGAAHVRQAVPLVRPQAPMVGTGLEEVIARNSGRVIYAQDDGRVISATADRVIVKYNQAKTNTTYNLQHYIRSNHDTALNQRTVVAKGQTFNQGQPLIEAASIDGGELALGRDLLVALMCWGGENFEDALVVSDRLVKHDGLTSIHISEHSIEVRETDKLGPETVTRDIPNVSEKSLRHLDEDGIIREGAEVKTGDILVGKITPKGEQELSNEDRLLRVLFNEKAKDIRDSSLRLPTDKGGKVIGIKHFRRSGGAKLKPGVLEKILVFVAQTHKIQVGDKLEGRHGNKGVIARILPEEDMPFTADGRPVDLILNPLGVPARMNLGQLFESHLGSAVEKLGLKVSSPTFNGAPNIKIQQLLKQADLPDDGKQQLYDGRTGEPFGSRSTVGCMYFYKLKHMIANNMHVRSTGPYTMVSQQPLGGKSQNGGQRFGEMEVWALEAYGAAYCLQEILTIKSDDLVGRSKAYESIVKQTEITNPKVPESFKVLVKELQALNLKINLIDSQTGSVVDFENLLKPPATARTTIKPTTAEDNN